VHDFHRNQDGIFCQKVSHLVHVFLVFPSKHIDIFVCLRRHEISKMPDSEEELGVWLRDLFKEKV
jgi:hypothetical protein